MAEARHHQQHLHALVAVVDLRFHAELLRDRLEAVDQCILRNLLFGNEGDAHEELAGIEIVELAGIDDIAALIGQIVRDRRNDPARRLARYG